MRVRGRTRLLSAVAVAAGLVISGMASTGYATAVDPGATRTATRAIDPSGTERADSADPITDRDGGRDAGGTMPGEPSGTEPNDTAPSGTEPEQVGLHETVNTVLGYAGERTHKFRFPGARYVKLHFSRLAVPPGGRMTVADPSGNEIHSYRADPTRVKLPGDAPITYDEAGGFWAMSVSGDTAVVTLESAPEAAGLMTRYGATIDKVARGLTGDEAPVAVPGRRGDAPPAGPGSEESVCGRDDTEDAVCYKSDYPAEYAHSRPVARLLIDGRSLCTAWRIGPNNRLLTNHHCFRSTGSARNTEVWFNYQCVACGDRRVTTPTKVVGGSVLATERELDYTLFTVSGFDKIRDFGHLTLDSRRADRGEEVYIPQHPGGDPKQISLHSDVDARGACRIDEPVYPGYTEGSDASYYCDTAPGSSGSPVLSRRTHKVVALHHFGGCPNSGVRADLLYRAIGDQL
ncbi:MAG: trypsin-like serine peptidase [Micromonosporaceae bacterium]